MIPLKSPMLVSHTIVPAVHGECCVRINLAWYSEETLRAALETTSRPVVLDLPVGRSKPPWTSIDYSPEGIIRWVAEFKQVRYLAISNVETPEDCLKYTHVVPGLSIIPKIESVAGVKNIETLLAEVPVSDVMIDHDDLYVNAEQNGGPNVDWLIDRIKTSCAKAGCRVMMARGVVFGVV